MGALISLWIDASHALRRLRRSPRFVAAVLLSLGLGNALTIAAFAAINAVVLRPFPYHASENLCVVWGSTSWDIRPSIEPDTLAAWIGGSRSVEDGEFFQLSPAFFTTEGGESIQGSVVGPRMFALLGVAPSIGRPFATGREKHTDQHAVVLSHAFWISHFGGRPSALGTPLRLNGRIHTVIGVMPPQFFFPDQHARLWTLIDEEMPPHAVVRLRPGAKAEEAQAELNDWQQSTKRRISPMRHDSAGVFPLVAVVSGQYQVALGTLLAAALALLLIASANSANLILARGHAKKGELAVFAALGASPLRLARLVAAECFWLGLGGALIGLVVGFGALHILRLLRLTDVLRLDIASIDGSVVAFGVAASVVSTLVAALLPVLYARTADVRPLLQAGGVGTRGSADSRVRTFLVTMETSLALILLILSGLLAGSFVRLVRVSWGFDPERLVALEVTRPQRPAAADWSQVERSVAERLSSLPAVQSSALSFGIPIQYRYKNVQLGSNGRLSASAQAWTVGSGYFKTMRIPLHRGREFEPQDGTEAPRVAVVSQDLAESLWPGDDPIGKEISILKFREDLLKRVMASANPRLEQARLRDVPDSWEPEGRTLRVVGEAGTVRSFGLDLAPGPVLYLDYRQDSNGSPLAYFVVRTLTNPEREMRSIRAAVSALVEPASIQRVTLMSELVDTSIGGRGTNKLLAVASILLGGIGLLFAALGVFSLVSLVVAQRAHETAIRRALGATPRRILLGLLGRELRAVMVGIGLGLGGAVIATSPIESLLFGVKPMDPLTMAIASITVFLAACFGCALPAIRGLAQDPVETLRQP